MNRTAFVVCVFLAAFVGGVLLRLRIERKIEGEGELIRYPYCVVTGVSGTLSCSTMPVPMPAYVAGACVLLVGNPDTVAGKTLNVDGLGPKKLLGDLVGGKQIACYDGEIWQLEAGRRE